MPNTYLRRGVLTSALIVAVAMTHILPEAYATADEVKGSTASASEQTDSPKSVVPNPPQPHEDSSPQTSTSPAATSPLTAADQIETSGAGRSAPPTTETSVPDVPVASSEPPQLAERNSPESKPEGDAAPQPVMAVSTTPGPEASPVRATARAEISATPSTTSPAVNSAQPAQYYKEIDPENKFVTPFYKVELATADFTTVQFISGSNQPQPGLVGSKFSVQKNSYVYQNTTNESVLILLSTQSTDSSVNIHIVSYGVIAPGASVSLPMCSETATGCSYSAQMPLGQGDTVRIDDLIATTTTGIFHTGTYSYRVPSGSLVPQPQPPVVATPAVPTTSPIAQNPTKKSPTKSRSVANNVDATLSIYDFYKNYEKYQKAVKSAAMKAQFDALPSPDKLRILGLDPKNLDAAGAAKVAKIAGKALGLAGTVLSVAIVAREFMDAKTDDDRLFASVDAAATAAPFVGAAVGAAFGALGFGVGAVPGAVAGAALGSAVGIGLTLGSEAARNKDVQKFIQNPFGWFK